MAKELKKTTAANNGVTISKDNMAPFQAAIKKLTQRICLVGITSDTAPREEGTDITNAVIGYISEFGSPANNIPARPFLIPGVNNVKDQIASRLKVAGQKALDGNIAEIDRQLTACGLLAVTSVQQKITEGPFQPLAPSTLAARRARGVTRTQPLIDTGVLWQSITFVLRDRDA